MGRLLLGTLWLVLSLAWLAGDFVPRDGDEQGHVGAAELFLAQLEQGNVGAFAGDALAGPLGEYPPLFPAIVGFWWWLVGGGLPGRLAVRAVCLLSVLLTAWAVGRLGSRQSAKTEQLAFVGVLLLPLVNGLGRHFMPEGLLVGAVALTVLVAVRLSERPTWSRALGLAACLGLGLLVKQTFVVYVVLPLSWIAWQSVRQEKRHAEVWFGAALGGVGIAGPWYVGQWGDQMGYAGQSWATGSTAGWWEHLVYYPSVFAWQGVGPGVGLAFLVALVLMFQRKGQQGRLALVWLVGGIVLLTFIPKKYPRLIAPLSPAAVLLAAVFLNEARHKSWHWLCGVVALVWLWMGSVSSGVAGRWVSESPRWIDEMDPGCTQQWLRPAIDSDLGLSAVAQFTAKALPGPVKVRGGPEIPCSLQTTHPWADHLGPYLRRSGQERAVVDQGAAAVLIDWTGPVLGGETIFVSALDRPFWIRIESDGNVLR